MGGLGFFVVFFWFFFVHAFSDTYYEHLRPLILCDSILYRAMY